MTSSLSISGQLCSLNLSCTAEKLQLSDKGTKLEKKSVQILFGISRVNVSYSQQHRYLGKCSYCAIIQSKKERKKLKPRETKVEPNEKHL